MKMKREQAEGRARALGHPLTSWWPSTLSQEAHAACRCGAVTAAEFVPYSRDGKGSYVVLTARAGGRIKPQAACSTILNARERSDGCPAC